MYEVKEIDAIIVDCEDLIEVMRRNQRDKNESWKHLFRVQPPLKGEKKAKPFALERGNFYPPEMDVTPLHLTPKEFLAGKKRPCGIPNYPDIGIERRRFEEEPDAEDFDDWWEVTVEVWENRIRQHFNDKTVTLKVGTNWKVEAEIKFRESPSTDSEQVSH